MKKLNPKLLPVAAFLLMVLALFMLATPLLRSSVNVNVTAGNLPFTLQGTPAPGMTIPSGGGVSPSTGQTSGQGYIIEGMPPASFPDGAIQGQGFPQDSTGMQFQRGGLSSLMGLRFLNGITGTIIYAIALIVSLVAAVGMFLTKLWGKVLGIVMAVLYLLVGLLGLMPIFLSQFSFRVGNSSNIILTVFHLVIALAVIVFASIPPKKMVEAVAEIGK